MKKAKIFICNDYIEELVDNPDLAIDYVDNVKDYQEETFEILYEASKKSIRGYKIMDYLFLLNFSSDPEYLYEKMVEDNILFKYIDSVVKRDDNFLKAFLYIYLKPVELNEMYKDKHKLIKDISEEGDYYLDYRVNALLELLRQDSDKETVDFVKKSVEKMTRNDKDVKESAPDQVDEIIESIYKEINKITKSKVYINQ